jgi:hypothetical protein
MDKRGYKKAEWDILGPQVLALRKEEKSWANIGEIIGVKAVTVKAWFYNHGKEADETTQPATSTTPTEEEPMSGETPVEVLDGQMSIDDSNTVDEVPMSTIVDIAPVDHEVDGPLSTLEVQTLEHYERIIAQGIQTFVEVGRALMAISEQRLYRQSYGTFEDYLRQRWDMSRPRAYQLIDAAQVIDTVSTSVDIVPLNEAQARPLASLTPDQQVEVWREVVETAPAGKVTAKHVKETVKRAKRQATGQNGITPKLKDPEPRRSARHEVQEGLVWGLREVKDEDAWELLVWFWTELNKRAPQYESLRGMLERVQRRFPEELRPQLSTAPVI